MKFTSKIIYFTISQFFFYKIHLGFFNKFLDSSLNFFLLKKFNFYFFNLNFTIIYFKLILNILKQLSSKKCSLFLSIPKKFNFLFKILNTVKSLNYVSNSWIPGLLTNFKNIYSFTFLSFIKSFITLSSRPFLNFLYLDKKKKKFLMKIFYQYFFLKKKGYFFNSVFLIPSFICFFNIEKNFFGINEAFFLNIPFSIFLDINISSWSSKYLIPGNSKTNLSLNFYYFLIIKSLYLGSNLEKLNFLFLIKKTCFSFILKFDFLNWYFYNIFNIFKNNFFIQLLVNFNSKFSFYYFFLLTPILNYFKKFNYLMSYKLKRKLYYFFFKNDKLLYFDFFFFFIYKSFFFNFFFEKKIYYNKLYNYFFFNNYIILNRSLKYQFIKSLKRR